jgi:hypothetical protein
LHHTFAVLGGKGAGTHRESSNFLWPIHSLTWLPVAPFVSAWLTKKCRKLWSPRVGESDWGAIPWEMFFERPEHCLNKGLVNDLVISL